MIRSQNGLRALLALDLIALLFAISFATMSASGPAERALGRSVAILTEVDTYLDEHFAAIQQRASQTPGERVTLPDYPLDITFSSEEVRQADRDQFRVLLIASSGAFVREHGMSAFDHQEGSGVSAAAGIRAGMGLLRPIPHAFFVALSGLLGLAALAIIAVLVRAGHPSAALRSIGLVMVVSSTAFLWLSIAAWLLFRILASINDDYLSREFLALAQNLTWAPIRDAFIVMVGSAAIAGAGVALGGADRTRPTARYARH